MKRKLFPAAFALLFAAAIFYGCAKKVVKTDMGGIAAEKPAAEAAKGTEKAPAETNVSGASLPEASSGAPARAAAEHNMMVEDVFFDFDRYSIRADSRKALEDDAAILKNNAGMKITIEGHCDERGPAEYNLALGQKRADSVKKYLKSLGIGPSRIATISFGSEKPFCTEHNEACWQKNRTAHFVQN